MDHIECIVEEHFKDLDAERQKAVTEKLIVLEPQLLLIGESVESLVLAIRNFISNFISMCETIVRSMEECFNNTTTWFDEYNFAWEDYQEQGRKRQMHKLEFTRPTIQHQVLERKPKQLVRKIIH